VGRTSKQGRRGGRAREYVQGGDGTLRGGRIDWRAGSNAPVFTDKKGAFIGHPACRRPQSKKSFADGENHARKKRRILAASELSRDRKFDRKPKRHRLELGRSWETNGYSPRAPLRPYVPRQK